MLLAKISNITRQQWLYIISFVFVALNSFAIANEVYWLTLLPVAIIIALMAIFSLDKLVLLAIFFTPLSITLKNLGFGLSISLPTEPLLFIILSICILKFIYEGKINTAISSHIITTAIIVNIIWLVITTITSEMPFVSFKFVIARLWFVVPYFGMTLLMFKNFKNIQKSVWLYIIPFLGVIFYIFIKHVLNGLTEQAAHRAPIPFFSDHTSYGAVLAMFFPFLIYSIWHQRKNKILQIIMYAIFVVFFVALVLSYTRAAWISLIAAFGIFMIFILKIKFRTIAMVSIALVSLFAIFQTQIFMALEKNRQDSSSDFKEHVQSISNVSSDASNLERINRWKSAIRMFKERPIWGWGPGTYMFQYAPFQLSSEKTVISTNAGNKGNAHSEYIGPLSESGLLGSVSFVLILICISVTSAKIITRSRDNTIRMLTMSIYLGLVTYFVHGLFNNFLDIDKASAPFWMFTAIITAIDLYHSKEENLKI